MRKVKVGTKTIEWVKKLHEAGAVLEKDGVTVMNPVIRQLISTAHAVLAGDAENAKYQELEDALEEAIAEASPLTKGEDSDDPKPLFP